MCVRVCVVCVVQLPLGFQVVHVCVLSTPGKSRPTNCVLLCSPSSGGCPERGQPSEFSPTATRLHPRQLVTQMGLLVCSQLQDHRHSRRLYLRLLKCPCQLRLGLRRQFWPLWSPLPVAVLSCTYIVTVQFFFLQQPKQPTVHGNVHTDS